MRAHSLDAAVEVRPYDNAWPAMFEAERRLLELALAPWLVGAIEHIGSTAVPNMPAKPVIDIMAPVGSLAESLPALAAVQALGYLHHPYQAEVMHWFCKPSPDLRTHHLHLVPLGSPLWHERLRFRDALRGDPELAAEYLALKLQLARQFPRDREAYTEGKTSFVHRVVASVPPLGLAR